MHTLIQFTQQLTAPSTHHGLLNPSDSEHVSYSCSRTLLCPLLPIELYTHLSTFSKDVAFLQNQLCAVSTGRSFWIVFPEPLFMLLSHVIPHEIAVLHLYLSPTQSEFLKMTLSAYSFNTQHFVGTLPCIFESVHTGVNANGNL